MAALYGIYLLLILYFCLYPFDFRPVACLRWFPPVRLATVNDWRDLMTNVLLYVPFGWLGREVWRRVPGGRWVAVVAGFALSLAVELLQQSIPERQTSLRDLIANTAGAALGAWVWGWGSRRLAGWALWERPVEWAMAGTFLLAKLNPLVPWLSPYAVMRKWEVLSHGAWSSEQFLLGVVEAGLLVAICGERRGWTAGVLGAGTLGVFLIPGSYSNAGVLVGNLFGGLFLFLPRWVWRTSWPALVAVVFFTLRQLAPYHLEPKQREFSWVPFAFFIESTTAGVSIVMGKALFYLGMTTVWCRWWGGLAWPVVGVAIWVGMTEWLQQYLPGRTPELTDPALVALAGAVLFYDRIYVIRSRESKENRIPAAQNSAQQ